MPAETCACPFCGVRLKAPARLPAQKKCPQCARHFAIAATPPPPSHSSADRARQRLGGAIGSVIVAAALIAAGVAVWYVYQSLTPSEARAEGAKTTTAGAPVHPRAPGPIASQSSSPTAPKPANAPPSPPLENPVPAPPPVAFNPPTPALPSPAGLPTPVPKAVPASAADPVFALPEAEQREVNQAIERGTAYLKTCLTDDKKGAGDSYRQHPGAIALAGLTLLECGVSPRDPAVQKAAKQVRAAAGRMNQTYTLGLAILFLDRLDEPEDEKLIHAFALRLIAGQNSRGGWTYQCPLLDTPQQEQLLTVLERLPPLKRITSATGLDRLASDPAAQNGSLTLLRSQLARVVAAPLAPTGQLMLGPIGVLEQVAHVVEADDIPRESGIGTVAGLPSLDKSGVRGSPPGQDRVKTKPPIPEKEWLPELRNIPALKVQPNKPPPEPARAERDDNSNTQFAILGLWVARRHGVPIDRALVLVERRFRSTQQKDGSWGYSYGGKERPASMTCAGLLGLGLAAGREFDMRKSSAAAGTLDPDIEKGLKYLGSTIGKSGAAKPPRGKRTGRLIAADSIGDLYYLWSVERVAMAYGLKTIAGKEWYRWGAELLVDSQLDDGSWRDSHPSIPDTCFALLFLKRTNVARDLPSGFKGLYSPPEGK